MAPSDAGKRRLWFAALLSVTLLPLIGLPLLSGAQLPFRDSFAIGLAVFIGGVGHVASTAYFYFDGGARTVMKPMKLRFFALPAVVVAVAVIALFIGARIGIDDGIVYWIFLFHLVWLYYHYQKQNYGLLAFAAASVGGRVPRETVWILLLPPLAGGLATIPALLAAGLEREIPAPAWMPLLDRLAIAIYAIAAVAMIRLTWTHRALFAQPLVAAFAAASFAFFLPALLIRDLDFAFWSYALAHGFQYLLMVYIVSGRSRTPWLALPIFVVAVAVGGWFLNRMGGNHALFICGILLTWVHFVLDARLWRMRDAGARQFLRDRFSFIFG
ncbi:MAG: hypothetical protein KIT73_08290 [Burkholderiales bacterium]|nr:hypothetical protein [Burkholderiales bacterium]